MRNWTDDTYIEVIEMLAEEKGWIASEDELSQQFDDMVDDMATAKNGIDAVKYFNDITAITEDFNNWTDVLCKDGEIHPEQYDKYCYVGIHSE